MMHEIVDDDEGVTRRECYLHRSALENRMGGFETQMVELKMEMKMIKESLDGFREDLSRMMEDRIKFEAKLEQKLISLESIIGNFETILYKKLTWVLILLLVAAGGVILGRVIDVEQLVNLIP